MCKSVMETKGYERIDIETDINDSKNCECARVNKPPQFTPFIKIFAKDRFVHYRRWTDFSCSDKKL